MITERCWFRFHHAPWGNQIAYAFVLKSISNFKKIIVSNAFGQGDLTCKHYNFEFLFFSVFFRGELLYPYIADLFLYIHLAKGRQPVLPPEPQVNIATYTDFSFKPCFHCLLCIPASLSHARTCTHSLQADSPFFSAAAVAAAACKWLPDGKWHFHRTLWERRGDLSSFQHKVLLIAWSHLWAQLTNSCKSIVLLGTQGLSPLYVPQGNTQSHAYKCTHVPVSNRRRTYIHSTRTHSPSTSPPLCCLH